jgi:acetoin utilization protein AcuB
LLVLGVVIHEIAEIKTAIISAGIGNPEVNMIKIKDCMKPNVVTISPDVTLREAAQAFIKKHVGTLVVVDADGHLLGLILLRDLISLAIPDFIDLFKQMDFIHDFGALESNCPNDKDLFKPIRQFMMEPISVHENTGLLNAAALLQEHKLSDLPVVNNANVLVGIASATDIDTALLSGWDIQ